MKIITCLFFIISYCTGSSKQEKCNSYYKNRNPLGIVSCQQYIGLELIRQEAAIIGQERNTSNNFRDSMLLSCIIYNNSREKCSEEDKYIPYIGNKYED